MNTAVTEKKTPRVPFVLFMLLGLLFLAGAAYLWLGRPTRPVAMEGGLRPVGFSLGLDDPAIVRIDRQGARAFWRGSARIMPNGFAAGVAKLWPDLEQSLPDAALARVKIIPTGGLFPFYRSSTFAGEIEAFVRGGGSLICFGQPLGAMYRALPGGLEAVGWAETVGQAKTAASPIQAVPDHPTLAALTQGEFAAHFGGFFTKLPGTDQTQAILRDPAIGRPVAVAYRHGRGLVVATTLLSDAAVLGSRLGRDERVFLRELLVWAQAGGGGMPVYMPGDSVAMVYRLAPGDVGASDGFVELRRPDGSAESFACPLPGNGGQEVVRPLSVSEPRGIWRAVSYRRGIGSQPVGPVSSAWFVVGHAPEIMTVNKLFYTVVVPGPYLATGSVAPLLVSFWNDGAEDSEITYTGPAGKRTVKLPAGQKRSIGEEVGLNKPGVTSLNYEFYGPNGERLGQIKRRMEVGRPDRVFLTLTEVKSAVSGQVVRLNLQILSANPGNYKADCWLRLVHDGKILWQEPRRVEVTGAFARTEEIKIPLPPRERGRFVLEAVLAHDRRELARVWTEWPVL